MLSSNVSDLPRVFHPAQTDALWSFPPIASDSILTKNPSLPFQRLEGKGGCRRTPTFDHVQHPEQAHNGVELILSDGAVREAVLNGVEKVSGCHQPVPLDPLRQTFAGRASTVLSPLAPRSFRGQPDLSIDIPGIGLDYHDVTGTRQIVEGAVEGPQGNLVQMGAQYLPPARNCTFADLIAAQRPEETAGGRSMWRRAFAGPQQGFRRKAKRVRQVKPSRSARPHGIERASDADLSCGRAHVEPVAPFSCSESRKQGSEIFGSGQVSISGRDTDGEVEADDRRPGIHLSCPKPVEKIGRRADGFREAEMPAVFLPPSDSHPALPGIHAPVAVRNNRRGKSVILHVTRKADRPGDGQGRRGPSKPSRVTFGP